VPYILAVAVEVPDVAALNVVLPGPDTWVHNPDPSTGVFPPSDPLTRLPQLFNGEADIVAAVGVA
jgi:hypothetical protein